LEDRWQHCVVLFCLFKETNPDFIFGLKTRSKLLLIWIHCWNLDGYRLIRCYDQKYTHDTLQDNNYFEFPQHGMVHTRLQHQQSTTIFPPTYPSGRWLQLQQYSLVVLEMANAILSYLYLIYTTMIHANKADILVYWKVKKHPIWLPITTHNISIEKLLKRAFTKLLDVNRMGFRVPSIFTFSEILARINDGKVLNLKDFCINKYFRRPYWPMSIF